MNDTNNVFDISHLVGKEETRCFFCGSSAIQRKRYPTSTGCTVCNPQRGGRVNDFRDQSAEDIANAQDGLFARMCEDMRRYGPTPYQRAKGLLTVQDLETKYGRKAI